MRRPDLGKDPRFLTPELRLSNLEALHRIVQEWIWTFGDMESLDAQLDEAKIATGQVRSTKDFADSHWARDWHAVRPCPTDRRRDQDPGPSVALRGPGRADEGQLAARQGEHNAEVLKELGFSASEIGAFEASGALVQPGRNGAPSSPQDPALASAPTLRRRRLYPSRRAMSGRFILVRRLYGYALRSRERRLESCWGAEHRIPLVGRTCGFWTVGGPIGGYQWLGARTGRRRIPPAPGTRT